MSHDPFSHPILFFDGECNLCTGLVSFIIRHDKKKIFLFAPLQEMGSEFKKALPPGMPEIKQIQGDNPDQLSSVVLLYKSQYFLRSGAALQTMKLLGAQWRLLYAGIIIPRMIRDGIYDLIARNRYKWFGKRNTCVSPTPELMDRFLK